MSIKRILVPLPGSASQTGEIDTALSAANIQPSFRAAIYTPRRLCRPRALAQQAGEPETRALFAGSQGGTVARAGGNTWAPLSVVMERQR